MGLVRVILTTNFDRLIERALDARGVPYIVTATPAAVAGALPLHLQRCQVIKLHGDYLDPGFLNTPEELATYDPLVDRLLDRVFDEHGLIVIGWSATYDGALRSAIERTETRRFSTWWVDPGSLSDNARRLADLRGATVAGESADTFLGAVAEAAAALEETDRPAPQTVALAVAMAKRSVGTGGDRIRLHDQIKEQLARVAASPQVDRDSFQSADLDSYGRDVAALEAEMEILLGVVAIAAYWGDRQVDDWWIPAIVDFAERAGRPPAGGTGALINLTRYPGLLLFQTGAAAATAAQRWDLLARLDALQLDASSSGRRGPAACALDPGQILGGFYKQNGQLTGLEANDRPVDHLRNVVRSTLARSLLLTAADLDRTVETTEYLLAVLSVDWSAQASETDSRTMHAPPRYGGYWLPRAGMWGQETPRIARHARAVAAADGGPVEAGLFDGSMDRFVASADQFDAAFQNFAQRTRFQ
jgi:SIR2-like domain